jgi:diguanylate cyclase (GGDEF)-like protein/PAS domain S-box-containing protein
MLLKSFVISREDWLPKEATISQAIEKMNSNNLRYVVLVDGKKPISIITERDILHAIYGHLLNPKQQAKAIGAKSLIKANKERTIDYALGLMLDYGLRRLVVIDNDGKYFGVIEQEEIIHHFESEAFRSQTKLYDLLQSASIAKTIDEDAQIKEAIAVMVENKIGSILVCKKNQPFGIITESDILRHSFNANLKELTCKQLAQEPLIHFNISQTVEDVLKKTKEMGIRRIAVYDGQNDNYMIITTRDILRNLQGNYSLFLEKKIYASRLLFDQMSDIMIEVLSLNSGYIVGWANQAAKDTFNISVDDSIDQYLPHKLWEKTIKAFNDGKTSVEEVVNFQQKAYRYNATKTDVLGTEVIKLLLSDISSIYQLNLMLSDELTHKQNLYKETFNQTVIGIGYIDPDGTILGVNPYITECLGYTKEELVGKNVLDFAHPDDKAIDLRALEDFCQQKGRISDSFQRRYRKKSGEWIWVEIHLSAYCDKDGKLDHIVGFMQDVTERKMTEEALNSQQKLISTVVNSVEDLIFYKDTDGFYLGGNEAWLKAIGLSLNKVMGKRDEDLFPPKIAKVLKKNDKKVFETQKASVFIEEALYENKETKVFETHKSPLIDENGNVAGLVGIAHDVTQRREEEKRQRLAQSVFDNTIEGIMVTDSNKIITSVNPAFTTITGYSLNEAIGKRPSMLSSNKHDKNFYKKMWKEIDKTGSWQGEIWNKRKDGELYPELLTISKIVDEDQNVINYIGVFSDISLMKHTQEKLEYIAHHDPLTMLPNRLLLEARLEHSIEWAKQENFKIAVLFLDLDHFKEINDAFGRSMGDEVLIKVARRLKGLLKEEDTIARIGGDEFIIMVEHCDDLISLEKTIQNILNLFEKPIRAKDHSFKLTCSIGVSLYPNDGQDMETLIKNADAAMYQAKESGRNMYTFYTSEITHTLFEKMLMENELRRAIKSGEFILHYQPQVDMRNKKVVGVEALARWDHPGMGIIMPDKFIPLAESSRLIVPIGRSLLYQACKQAKKWVDTRKCQKGWRMAVNISAVQMVHDDLFSVIIEATKKAKLDPSYLELELTETYIMDNPKESRKLMQKLKTLGLTLAIDDFGIGYSSLSYLKQFPIDRIKIDRSFVRDIPEDNDDMAITKAILALGKSLGLEVIAEGVENEVQKSFLIEQGCYFAQGYLYSPPDEAKEIEKKDSLFFGEVEND